MRRLTSSALVGIVVVAAAGCGGSDQPNARTRVDRCVQGANAIENPLLRCGLLFAGCNNRDKIPAKSDVRLVGEYTPTAFKMDGFKRGVKP